ncbi:osmoprotectant transport system permease protein [Paraburkholderia youngii]|uniref:ABC transporter permease n=1 Tax=Paraburkholderia youngii TaxID=2782701 RepID=A0A7W8NZM0_9BURK|nr:ABC transporter permease [Paraburkholderia youngii]MBB5398056.1 osmoprotectant transport system permease protein [Paraburkholderia youngii]NUX56604.1 ABC transporter permease [Paraburkholderia youngii]NVI05270.1 ABC transporter permease [Paraburkholderia youngii]
MKARLAFGALIASVSVTAHADNWLASIGQFRADIAYQAGQQMLMVLIAGVAAILVAVPAGVWLSRPENGRAARFVMFTFNAGQAVPKLAILALAMSVLGIGAKPAILALWLATLLPIAMNTYEGIRAVPPALIEAANGIGMTRRQILFRVELPNAMFVILAGVRTALAITVGTAPLAFLVGGGGLGELIFTGIDLNDFGMLLAGAIPTALLAVATDLFVAQIQHWIVPRGVSPQR